MAHNVAIGNDAVVVVEEGVLAVCYSADAAGPGQAGLFCTSSEGLLRIVFDHDENEYVVSEPLPDTQDWEDAVELHADPVDGLFGVDSTRHVILRSALEDGEPEAPEALFSIGPSVSDMRLMEWGATAIAMQHSNGLAVRDQSGNVLYARSAYMPSDPYKGIAVLQRGEAPDVLAWAQRRTNGAVIESLLLLVSGGYGSPFSRGPYVLNEERYDSASAGDLDGDGLEELVLATRASNEVLVVKDLVGLEEEAAFHQAMIESVSLATGTPTLPNGNVLCADLFNDRIIGEDYVERARAAVAMVLADFGALRLIPRIGDESSGQQLYNAEDFAAVHCDPFGTCDDAERVWTIDIGTGWGTIGNATHMQIKVRRSLEGSSEAEPQSINSPQFVPLSGGNTVGAVLTFTASDPSETQIGTRYFAVVRPVKLQENQVVQAWRTSILSMSARCDGEEWLRGLPGAFGDEDDVLCIAFYCPEEPALNCVGCEPPYGPYFVPSAVPQSQVPSPGPGILPGDPPN